MKAERPDSFSFPADEEKCIFSLENFLSAWKADSSGRRRRKKRQRNFGGSALETQIIYDLKCNAEESFLSCS